MNAMTQPALALRDIHLPADPSAWPPAPGWWLLGLLSVVGLALFIRWLVRALRERRRRRAILARLQDLECELLRAPSPECLAEVSALLKQLALKHHPRDEVASLSGTDWLLFLDRTGGEGLFGYGPGKVLAKSTYQLALDNRMDVPGLMQAVRRWVKRNQQGAI